MKNLARCGGEIWRAEFVETGRKGSNRVLSNRVLRIKTHFSGFMEIWFCLIAFWLPHPNRVLVCYAVI
jgi:hypothetical protein